MLVAPDIFCSSDFPKGRRLDLFSPAAANGCAIMSTERFYENAIRLVDVGCRLILTAKFGLGARDHRRYPAFERSK